jgi:hypothetical protein
MRRTLLATATLLGYALFASAVSASGPGAAHPSLPAIVGKSLDLAPQSRMEGNQAIDDATAAALIGAISNQFGERTVEVKLDKVVVTPAGIIQRELHGAGRLLIGKDAIWIPFRFTAIYDTEQASVGYPDLVLGGGPSGQTALADATMTRKLTVEVDRRLHQEFAQQPVHIALDKVHVVPAGDRYLRLQANGTAQFGSEGATEAGVQALYDVRTGNWLQVSYELGTTSDRPSRGNAIASR